MISPATDTSNTRVMLPVTDFGYKQGCGSGSNLSGQTGSGSNLSGQTRSGSRQNTGPETWPIDGNDDGQKDICSQKKIFYNSALTIVALEERGDSFYLCSIVGNQKYLRFFIDVCVYIETVWPAEN